MLKLRFDGQQVDLKSPLIAGIIDIQKDDPRSPEELLKLAVQMKEDGADLLEVGVARLQSAKEELIALSDALPLIIKESGLQVAINTRHPEVMRQAVEWGSVMIIDPSSLREPWSIETVAELKVPVCLVFDGLETFENAENLDPVSVISEFLYERIDACLNAKIPRQNIIIDPSVGLRSSFEVRLKVFGRLSTFKSFALPLTMAVPRALPYPDEYMNEHPGVCAAIAAFAVNSGVNIIRTKDVAETALVIETHLACTKSAKPFRLTKAIMKALKKKEKEKDGHPGHKEG